MERYASAARIAILIVVATFYALMHATEAAAQVLACPAGSPSGSQVATGLFTNLRSPLNTAWLQGKANIDPIDPNDTNPFGTGTHTVGCSSDAGLFCASKGYTECDKVTIYLDGYNYTGLSSLSLQYSSLSAVTSNVKSVAYHSIRGPDAGKITDGVFAKDGDSWNDTTYAILIPFTGTQYGLTVDLGSVVSNLCGNGASTCKGPTFQGDKNAYRLDYSTDGVNWQCFGQFPVGSSDGLRTRGATSLSATSCPATLPSTFSARYMRVSAYSGDGNYSASELQIEDTTGLVVSRGRVAAGPPPAQITSGTPPIDGTAWNDKQAVLLAKVGPAHGVVVDLLSTMHLCGGSCGPQVQADKNTYQLDYSTDGYNWKPYGQIPPVSPTGLQTRGVALVNAPNPNPDFDARYVRVAAVTGDGNYSVSQITLRDTSNTVVSVAKPTFGPESFGTNAEYAPEGADWNDSQYAIVLRPCSTGNADSVCPSSTGGLPGLTAPYTIDLGSASFPITQIKLQADRHQFQVDSSDDLVNWKELAAFPAVSGSGLTTRVAPAMGTGRYIRVYGTAGDDSNYSVSELDVITSMANTPCSYTPQYNANAGQNLSCSYDGEFEYALTLPATTTANFTVDSGSVRIYCTDVLGFSDSFEYESAKKGAICSANLSISSNTVGGNYCAGTCASGSGAALTYAQFGTDGTNPQATASSVSCPSLSSDFVQLAGPLFEGVAEGAIAGLMNGVLGPPPGILPFPGACKPATTPPPGDLNEDGKVDCADLAIIKSPAWGKRAGQLGFDPRADVNKDDIVDMRDWQLVIQRMPPGWRCP